MKGAWAIFRFGKEYPETMPGLRYPVAAAGEFWKQMCRQPEQPADAQSDGAGAVELAGNRHRAECHRQSGIYPFQTAALSRKGIAGLISIEPGACPAPSDDMKPYAGLPSWCCGATMSTSFRGGRHV